MTGVQTIPPVTITVPIPMEASTVVVNPDSCWLMAVHVKTSMNVKLT